MPACVGGCYSLLCRSHKASVDRCTQISMGTRFWAAGMAEPQPLEALRELRWLMSLGAGGPPARAAAA